MEALHIIEPKVNQDTHRLLPVKQNNLILTPGIKKALIGNGNYHWF